MRKIPFAGVELTPQRVRGLRGTSELPGDRYLYFVRISKACVHPSLPKYFFLSSLLFPRIFLSAIHFIGWQRYYLYTPTRIGLESGTAPLFIRAPYCMQILFPAFKLLPSFCRGYILYGVGHKNPGMPPCSLNPYRSVQCYIWDTLWLILDDSVSAARLLSVLPYISPHEVCYIWLADWHLMGSPLFYCRTVNIFIVVGRLMVRLFVFDKNFKSALRQVKLHYYWTKSISKRHSTD